MWLGGSGTLALLGIFFQAFAQLVVDFFSLFGREEHLIDSSAPLCEREHDLFLVVAAILVGLPNNLEVVR